jgi:hypothetical protein
MQAQINGYKNILKVNIVKYLIAPSCQFPTNDTQPSTSPPQCRTRTPTSSFQGGFQKKIQKIQNIRIGAKNKHLVDL